MNVEFKRKGLVFKSVNFNCDAELCLRFREDSFLESFGTTKPFYEKDATGNQYLEWLKNKIGPSYTAKHIWYQNQIIGQMELGRRKIEDEFGYVNLY